MSSWSIGKSSVTFMISTTLCKLTQKQAPLCSMELTPRSMCLGLQPFGCKIKSFC